MILALAACGADPAPSDPPGGDPAILAGTSWIVVSVAGRAPMPGSVSTMEFNGDRVTGSGGCNHFGGRFELDPETGRFAASDVSSTLIGCVQPGVGDFESGLLGALGAATRAGIDPSGQLILDGPAGRIVLATLEHPAASA
jgi:heat shock protein HslJ